MKTIVEKHFDKVAKDYDKYKKNSSFYYDNLKKLLSVLIPKNKKVLEIGCGTGSLIAYLDPKMGYGMDLSEKMVKQAKFKHMSKRNIEFSTIWPSGHSNHFDYIFMSDVIEHLEVPSNMFSKIYKQMNSHTLFINTMANPIWEPILTIWEKLGWKMPEGPHKRIGYKDIKVLIEDAGMKVIKHDYKLLIPIKIPYLTNFMNKYLEKPFKRFAFIEYFVAVRS